MKYILIFTSGFVAGIATIKYGSKLLATATKTSPGTPPTAEQPDPLPAPDSSIPTGPNSGGRVSFGNRFGQ